MSSHFVTCLITTQRVCRVQSHITLDILTINQDILVVKGAVSRNSAKLGNYKMPVKLRET